MREAVIAPSAKIVQRDEGAAGLKIARERMDSAGLNRVMSNSFGFGGTNATLIFQRYNEA